MSTEEELTAAINAKGEDIKVLKAAKPATMKEDLVPLIAELLALKLSFKEVTGEDFGPKPVEKKKEVQVEKKSDGPSKTELNKMKRKADKAEKRAEAKGDEVAVEANVATKSAAEVILRSVIFYKL